MRNFFSIGYLAVLVCCTLLAARMWYTSRGTSDPAQRRVLARFALGIAVFWLVAIAGYLGGFFTAPD
jgi:hypothetical protein